MKFFEQFLDQNLTLFALALVAVMMLARAVGYRLGARRAEKPDEGRTILIGGILGLMSFVLAFNLSTATSRLDTSPRGRPLPNCPLPHPASRWQPKRRAGFRSRSGAR